MPDKYRELIEVTLASLILSSVVYVTAPQRKTLIGVVRALTLSVVTASLLWLWFWGNEEFNPYQKVVIISIASSLSDFVVTGVLRLLVKFKSNPIETIEDIRGGKK